MNRTARISAAVLAAALFAACSEQAKAPEVPAAPPVVDAPHRPQLRAAEPAPAPAPPERIVIGLAHGACDGDAAAHLEEGRGHVAEGRKGEAIAAFRAALEHDGASVEAVESIARHAAAAGQHALGRQAAALWAALAPDDAAPLLRGARLAMDAGDDEAALALVDRALERDAASAEAYHLKGRLYFRADQFGAAIAAFESAVELDDGHAWAFNGKGLSHLRLGQWKEAMEALTAATLLRPDVAVIHNNLGIAYERLGYENEALAEYRMAITLDPRYVKAQVNYQRLTAVADAQYFVIERPAPPQE